MAKKKRARKRATPDKMRLRVRRVIELVAGGAAGSVAEAARSVKLRAEAVYHYRERHPELWQQEVDRYVTAHGLLTAEIHAALEIGTRPRSRSGEPSPMMQERLRDAAALVAGGATIREAAASLGLGIIGLRGPKRRFPDFWQQALDRARAERDRQEVFPPAPEPPRIPPPDVAKSIRRVVSLSAAGYTLEEVAGQLELKPGTLDAWEETWHRFWHDTLDRAMTTAVEIVRRQAGTVAVLDDPDTYLRQALAADTWIRRRGEELLPDGGEITLSQFYRDVFKVRRLGTAAESSVRAYDSVVRKWALLTGDPPLAEITNDTMALFRDAVARTKGKDGATPVSPNTVRSVLRHVQGILDLAGPASRHNREGAGIIQHFPYAKPPRARWSPPRFVPPEHFAAVYQAANTMTRPEGLGFPAAAWWRAILVVAWNLQLRRGTLLRIPMVALDWQRRVVRLKAEILKSGRGELRALSEIVIDHLAPIRSDRPLLFPWPYAVKTLSREFHRLQERAGIPQAERFGFRDVRRTAATTIWQVNPDAARLALGHRAMDTTATYYVNHEHVVKPALAGLPQPWGDGDNGAKKPAE